MIICSPEGESRGVSFLGAAVGNHHLCSRHSSRSADVFPPHRAALILTAFWPRCPIRHGRKMLYCAVVIASFLHFCFYLNNHTHLPLENISCGHHSSSSRYGGQDDKSIILSSIRQSQTNIHPCSDSHHLLPFTRAWLRNCMCCCRITEKMSIPASTLQFN